MEAELILFCTLHRTQQSLHAYKDLLFLFSGFNTNEATLTNWPPKTDEELGGEKGKNVALNKYNKNQMNMEVAMMEHEVCLWLMTVHVRIIVTQTKWKGRLILQ